MTGPGGRTGPLTTVVLDWGIGGLDTFTRLAALWPGADLHYRSDSGFAPYGKVAPDALAARVAAVARDAFEGVPRSERLLVVACNAASTVLDDLELDAERVGVIAPGVELLVDALGRGGGRVAVLGGERTIRSGAHEAGVARRLPTADTERLLALVAQPLSAHVEAGRLDGPELLADLEPLLAEVVGARCTAALLACTHYPALLPTLERQAPGVVWLDPVADPERGLVRALAARFAPTGGRGARTLATSGDPSAMAEAALGAFGLRLDAAGIGRFASGGVGASSDA